jgi:hypothetical protein
MIREATTDDVLRIVDMVEALRLAVGGPVPVNRPHTARIVLTGLCGCRTLASSRAR